MFKFVILFCEFLVILCGEEVREFLLKTLLALVLASSGIFLGDKAVVLFVFFKLSFKLIDITLLLESGLFATLSSGIDFVILEVGVGVLLWLLFVLLNDTSSRLSLELEDLLAFEVITVLIVLRVFIVGWILEIKLLRCYSKSHIKSPSYW